jgi:hypothetical protein
LKKRTKKLLSIACSNHLANLSRQPAAFAKVFCFFRSFGAQAADLPDRVVGRASSMVCRTIVNCRQPAASISLTAGAVRFQ